MIYYYCYYYYNNDPKVHLFQKIEPWVHYFHVPLLATLMVQRVVKRFVNHPQRTRQATITCTFICSPRLDPGRQALSHHNSRVSGIQSQATVRAHRHFHNILFFDVFRSPTSDLSRNPQPRDPPDLPFCCCFFLRHHLSTSRVV